jgi:predicted alpha-1,2-mannosidase
VPSFLQNNQFSYFSDFSFWDTFRTVHPWYLLINEDLTMGFARSILEITFQQNAFPRWVLASYDSSCMNGIHGFSLFIELLHAGYINEFVDFKALHSLLLKQLTTEWPLNGRIDVENYLKLGYIPIESAKTAPSLSLSNYFDDYSFGIFSMYLNEIEIGTESFKRSLNFQTIWSAKDKLFCPKSINGSISCPENPTSPFALSNYVEGNALHYSYDVLHNIHHLIQLYSSRKEFQDTLEEFMMEHVKYHVKIGNEAVNPYFWMGNEHDFHVPWLFNYLPQGCVETQYWTRNLTFYHFTTSPDLGLPGNDDYGTNSVWFILASLGIYPIPGSSLFYLSSPRISTATIHVNHWKDSSMTKLEMITYNNSLENRYVQKLLINGKDITQPFIERSVLIRKNEDVKVEFFMHDQPNSGLCP